MMLKRILVLISTLSFEHLVLSSSCPRRYYNEPQGTLHSPSFNTSESYGNNMVCEYNIVLNPGLRIILEFITLSILGTMPNCTEDSLEIFVGLDAIQKNASIGKFCSCSNVSLPKIYSFDNYLRLVFKSDQSMKGAGFEANYTSDNNVTKLDPSTNCSTKLIGSSSGTVLTPNWPLQYLPTTSCVWTLQIPKSRDLRIFFASFHLEVNFLCKPNKGPLSSDDITISGNTTEGSSLTRRRICEMPDIRYFAVRDVKTLQINFESNSDKEGTGAVIGYATYSQGIVGSEESGCKAIEDIGSTVTTPPTATATSTPLPTPLPTTLPTPAPIPTAKQLSTPAIAGIVIGAVVAVALIIFLIWWCCYRKNSRIPRHSKQSVLVPQYVAAKLSEIGSFVCKF
ncbi:bone morphogenetic protein 1-like [Montipora capricornis]|uniref:bone morphogenetic protein 1-like n=1 Tax=Montipora capricornis TaxID=246305 RepID=UPI0035F12424